MAEPSDLLFSTELLSRAGLLGLRRLLGLPARRLRAVLVLAADGAARLHVGPGAVPALPALLAPPTRRGTWEGRVERRGRWVRHEPLLGRIRFDAPPGRPPFAQERLQWWIDETASGLHTAAPRSRDEGRLLRWSRVAEAGPAAETPVALPGIEAFVGIWGRGSSWAGEGEVRADSSEGSGFSTEPAGGSDHKTIFIWPDGAALSLITQETASGSGTFAMQGEVRCEEGRASIHWQEGLESGPTESAWIAEPVGGGYAFITDGELERSGSALRIGKTEWLSLPEERAAG